MTVNLLFGLPFSDSSACNKVLSDFFALDGSHIVCGGTTAQYVAKFLHKSVKIGLHYENPNIPPMAQIDGVDLVTEGIVTMTSVLEKFASEADVNCLQEQAQDGASLVYKVLCEANDVKIFVCKEENPANRDFPFLKSKVEIVQTLAANLRKLGKNVEVRA